MFSGAGKSCPIFVRMASYFTPDPDRTITSAWISQGYEIDTHEIQNAIDWDGNADVIDKNLGFGSTALGVLGTATLLGLSGITALMLPPLTLATVGALYGYNSAIGARRRELEGRFLQDFPDMLRLIESKLKQGESVAKVASAFDAAFRHYRRGDDEAIVALIQNDQDATSETLFQTMIQKPDDQGAARSQIETQAQSGVQAIAPGVAAAPAAINWNPATDLGRNPQSALIAGTPGSGKGMLVSNAVRTLRQRHPALTVMMIDPKGDPKERGYWGDVVNVFRWFSLMDCDDPDEGASWLLACMDEFRSLPSPKLLIFDEMLAAAVELRLAHKDMKAPQRFKKFVAGLVAQGDSLDAWIWAMSQSVQVDDLGLSGGVRTNLRAIGIISPKNMGAIEGLTSTRLIPPPAGGMDELRSLMASSPCDRAFYDAKIARWLPMPKLENHSGYDRDNRSHLAPPTGRGGTAPEPPPLSATVKVEAPGVVIERPEGLDEFPLVATIWDYLDGKEPRSLKQISNTMKNGGKIPEELLQAKIPNFTNYKDGIRTVLSFAINKGYIREVSEDSYEAIKKQ